MNKHKNLIPLELASSPGKHGIHNVPREWGEMARVFQAEIHQHVVRYHATVTVHAAYRGSWRVGYEWYHGNYRLEFRPWTYGVSGGWTDKHMVKRYSKRSIEQVRGIWDRTRPQVETYARGCKLIAMYRRTGLIPSHIAKAHQRRLQKDFGKRPDHYEDPAVQNRLIMMMGYYLRQHATCPKCKEKGFQETILGWACESCHHTLYDMGKELEWMTDEDNQQ